MPNTFANGKRAIAECDRCGFRFRLNQLRTLVIKTKNINFKVCDSCWEPDHPQLQLGMYPISDPQALRDPRTDRGEFAEERAAIVPVTGYLSGSERTFGLGQVGFVGVEVTIPLPTITLVDTGTMVAAGAERYLAAYSPAVGYVSSTSGLFSQKLYVSADGKTWAADTSAVTYGTYNALSTNNTCVIGTFSSGGGIVKYTAPNSAAIQSGIFGGAFVYASCWTGAEFVIFADNRKFATSATANAGSWVIRDMPLTGDTQTTGAAFGGGIAVALTATSDVYWSSNLLTFSKATLPLPTGTSAGVFVAYGGGKFVATLRAATNGSTGTAVYLLSSTDGASWTPTVQFDAPNSYFPTATLAYGGGVWFAVVDDFTSDTNFKVCASYDAVNWRVIDAVNASSVRQLGGIVYMGANRFLVVPASQDTSPLTSRTTRIYEVI